MQRFNKRNGCNMTELKHIFTDEFKNEIDGTIFAVLKMTGNTHSEVKTINFNNE